jgi:thiosulfate/3-mercaptopyruvate sulfurtransferase
MNRTIVCAAALCLAVTTTAGATPTGEADYANPHLLTRAGELTAAVEREDALTWMGAPHTLRIVDVRPPEAFARGHIPNAISLPASALTDPHAHFPGALKSNAEIAELLGGHGIGAESEIVIYGEESGLGPTRLFWVLEYLGHRQVSVLDGGIRAWTAAGGSTEPARRITMADVALGKGPRPQTNFAVNVTPRRIASADWVLAHRDDARVMVIDVRPPAAFARGHIPWAVNIPWTESVRPDGTMKPAAELAAHFADLGATPDRNIAVHCRTGEASAHSYFALRLLGYPRVRNYDRSWAEWGAANDLPTARPEQG